MSDIRFGRLRRLAKHLRGTHRAHKTFDFNIYANGEINKKGNYCGSRGCAIGEFPAVWPNEWDWKNFELGAGDVVHKSQEDENTNYLVIADFFSITKDQVNHLFSPMDQSPKEFGGQELDEDATADEVADNIDAFIEKFAS